MFSTEISPEVKIISGNITGDSCIELGALINGIKNDINTENNKKNLLTWKKV
jgi:hypothetical protein